MSSVNGEEARRQREISMFAKLASGETFEQPKEEEKGMFAAMASVENSGTFRQSSSPNAHKAVASSNLDAAVAALTGQQDDEPEEETPLEEVHLRQAHNTTRAPPQPMRNERVELARPLFFGPMLPPRVVEEARHAILETMQQLGLNLDKRPPLSKLPPHIRNVVGAMEAFGFGIPIFPCDVVSDDDDDYRGSEYVNTYQPVWGDVARTEREVMKRRQRQESGEEESSSEEESDDECSDQEEGTPTKSNMSAEDPNIIGSTTFPGSTSPKVTKSLLLRSKSAPVTHISDKDQFLQWARAGGKPTSSPPRNDVPKAPQQQQQQDALFSSWIRNGGKDNDVIVVSKPPKPKVPDVVKRSITAPDDKHLFSVWARGEADQSPTVTPLPPTGRKMEGTVVETVDGVGTDVSVFSQWARGSPTGKISPDIDDDDSPIVRSSSVKSIPGKVSPDIDDDDSPITSGPDKDTFSQWAQGTTSSPSTTPPVPDKDTFSQWAQGTTSSPSTTPPTPPQQDDEDSNVNVDDKDAFAKWARADSQEEHRRSSDVSLDLPDLEEKEKQMSEKDTFAQWARGDDDAQTNGGLNASVVNSKTGQPYDTFRSVPTATVDDYSDDDSVDRSELKRKVGMNEHLNAAIASLAREDTSSGERPMPAGTESIGVEESSMLLSQMGATTEGGRPLSNLEITNGAVPLFGCDDSPLPSETDLGIFQTKEDQLRSMEQRRSQEIIDKHTYPNIFGPIACPNPAQSPDDNHSWNSRTAPSSRKYVVPTGATGHQVSGPGIVPALDSPPKQRKNRGKDSPLSIDGGDTPSSMSSTSQHATPKAGRKRGPRQQQAKRVSFDANARFGWWNVPDETSDKSSHPASEDTEALKEEPAPLQLPPLDYSSPSHPVITRLTPTSEKLREENLPLSDLHSATSVAGTLPFMSDRPPSFRYLQIDTEAVGFPSLGGEIEPLFCSLAIYHVETTAPNSHDPRAAPVPNMQRCGRVTEVLNFDVVRDAEVEARCVEALWPYASSVDGGRATQGSRCGVFPLASNLNISNLYAILIVHKVLSDRDGVEAYTRSPNSEGKGSATNSDSELGKLRDKAEKMSRRHGEFLMPFAFGVAPLLQIFGTDIPTVVSSRAVQIPLFRFITGQGDRPIIDHIMVMLYPRADHKGIVGPAPLTNGGTAMLVMRNFGFLGLHSAVFSKGSLARDRLVDFSGELQVRRDESQDEQLEGNSAPWLMKDGTYVIPQWHKCFVSEPAVDGGRNPVLAEQTSPEGDIEVKNNSTEQAPYTGDNQKDKSKSRFYAQELAPVPLRLMPPTGKSVVTPGRVRMQRGRSVLRTADIDPSFYTTFCNELLCQPRLLHNVPKGNIAVKVEVREIEWSEVHQAYLAHTPAFGPSLHNPRRGPFLVTEAFTACGFQAVHAHFLDEFKVKLPLILSLKTVGGGVDSGPLALFFSVYNVDLKTKRRWKDRAASDVESERKRSKIEVLACGFLPITTSDTSCLIDNGLHDVKLIYTSEMITEDYGSDETLLLRQIAEQKSQGTFSFRPDSSGRSSTDGGEEDSQSVVSEKHGTDGDGSFFGSESAPSESATESDLPRSETSSAGGRSRSQSKKEPMSLQVRIVVHSSVHPQNATLNEFLRRLPDVPDPLLLASPTVSPLWKLTKPELLKHLNTADVVADGDDLSDEMEKLLLFTIDVSKSSLCSAAESSTHFIRIFTQLVRTMVSGSGTPSLIWANPACAIPLRMHAFSTLLQIISSVNTYMVRNGAKQLDGRSKWNLTLLGKVVAMVFDEEQLFTRPGEKSSGELVVFSDWWSKRTNHISSKSPQRDMHSSAKTQRDRRREQMRSRQSRKADVKQGSEKDNDVGEESLDDFLANFASLSDSGGDSKDSLPDSSIPLLRSNDDLALLTAIPSTLSKASSDEGTTSSIEALENKNSELKIDSKSDFQSNLWAGSESHQVSPTSVTGSAAAKNMIQAYGGIGPSSRKKWMTAPSSGLATIREDVPGDADSLSESASRVDFGLGPLVTKISTEQAEKESLSAAGDDTKPGDSIDSELIRRVPSAKKIVMRVPNVKKTTETAENVEQANGTSSSLGRHTVPPSDDDIERAGSAFLEEIGKNLGYSAAPSKDMGGEEQRVGHAHHRKTRSRCSIDWTIPEVDLLMGNQAPLEQMNPHMSEDGEAVGSDSMQRIASGSTPVETAGAEDMRMSSLSQEEKNTVCLPNYLDRLVTLGKANRTGRWCPYAYEVIIVQWVSLLVDQRRSGDKQKEGNPEPEMSHPLKSTQTEYPPGSFSDGRQGLTDAVLRARGVSIACAPVLFEIIKKSIGWRVGYVLGQARTTGKANARKYPPLVRLDDDLLAYLEQLVAILTDACIDSRNFDSWEFRQTSIDVNDSIIRFLRDMFAFLDTGQVHRLILVYLSRFVVKDGKHWQDRDSKIGLRCSWEISKLRLNAVTMLVRFPDFVRVNSPQMQNWSNWSIMAPSHLNQDFFANSLEQLHGLTMASFSTPESAEKVSCLNFPSMKPHWLAELVTDICLAGTEHAEQYIQHRAASLLHELFWMQSQEAKASGTSAMVATMYVNFLTKVLDYTSYLASLTSKHQLRKDIIPCVVFVMQCAPDGILRALWRKLCVQAEGKGHNKKYGGVVEMDSAGFRRETEGTSDPNLPTSMEGDERTDPDIYDMFGLLNLALSTFQYEGCDADLEAENIVDSSDQLAVWKKEFLLAQEQHDRRFQSNEHARTFNIRHQEKDATPRTYSTTSSRKWNAHDGSIVIIHTSRLIVREMIGIQRSGVGDTEPQSDNHMAKTQRQQLNFSSVDIVVFVRAATSVYLHALSLNLSDIALVKTLLASVEIVKIYGIKVFLLAVGETLQHWMRVVSFLCGARRAEVRVQALEFLWLVLRLTWDSYGSFFRVRLPLLSVQTEVMERIVATATTRNYREQRRMGVPMQSLPNDCAEASLSPLWRTLDRLHHQSASQNLAFRCALIRLAENMKKLYRAYVAAHALSIVNRSRSPLSPTNSLLGDLDLQDESSAYLQSRRIIVHRIISASAGYCKQFLGLQRSSSQHASVAHNEAVEDAFVDAANVFSPTELPTNRFAWLQKLAEFHASRNKFAEEATCHFFMHVTLRQAARLRHWLWANLPFVPWTVNAADSLHLDGEGPAGDPEDYFDADYDLEDLTVEDPGIFESSLGKQIDKKDSFRRIFYRVANSLRMNTGDPEIGGNRNLFYGVTFASEYMPGPPWLSLRVLEEELVEEAELAGNLFLQAGIAESSRYAWSLATQIYAEKFNYGKLAHAYRKLANVVSSNVPVIDTNSHALELSHPLGRFYRVWFHGGAPDEINGTEFVYRAASSIRLEQFGQQLSEVIRGILPENTPIDLVLDEGRPDTPGFKPSQRRPLGPTPIEPVKIKVTPLRPLLKDAEKIRGTPEWFFSYADISFATRPCPSQSNRGHGRRMPRSMDYDDSRYDRSGPPSLHRTHHARSSSASVFASSGSVSSMGTSRVSEMGVPAAARHGNEVPESSFGGERGQLVGVDKFSFLQPVRKERNRSARDWLKSAGDIADKCLRVTQLQVERLFPACVARQTVMHRVVFLQSPLEAGIDAVCSWCSVLFRTAVATNGMAVLGAQEEVGIGNAAAKVVIDSMLSSRVKEMGLVLLKKDKYIAEQSDGGFGIMADFDRLSDDEVNKLQIKLARSIIIFMEILHLLIARNRDLLLEVMEARKRGEQFSLASGGLHRRLPSTGRSTPDNLSRQRGHARRPSNASHLTGFTSVAETEFSNRHADDTSISVSQFSHLYANERTDKAIAVQSELQRAFITMAKGLASSLTLVLEDETPRWLKEICRDNYFSSSTYKQSKIRMADEIYFYAADNLESGSSVNEYADPPFQVMSIDNSSATRGHHSESPSESQSGRSRGTNPKSRRRQHVSHASALTAESGGSSIFHV